MRHKKGEMGHRGAISQLMVFFAIFCVFAIAVIAGSADSTSVSSPDSLDAEVFTVKDIYYPGETVHIYLMPSDADYVIGVYDLSGELVAASTDFVIEQTGIYNIEATIMTPDQTYDVSASFKVVEKGTPLPVKAPALTKLPAPAPALSEQGSEPEQPSEPAPPEPISVITKPAPRLMGAAITGGTITFTTDDMTQTTQGGTDVTVIETNGIRITVVGAEIPDIQNGWFSFDNNMLHIDSIPIINATIELPHTQLNGITIPPYLYIKEDNESKFKEAQGYEKDGSSFNSVSVTPTHYIFNVEHFTYYYIQDLFENITAFNDTTSEDNISFFNWSYPHNLWINKTRYVRIYNWTNVTNASIDIGNLSIDERGMHVGDLNKSPIIFKGLAYDGTYFYECSQSGTVNRRHINWTLNASVSVNIPGGTCECTDLDMSPDTNDLMVLCSVTADGSDYLEFINTTTFVQDPSRNYTLTNGEVTNEYQAGGYCNNYFVVQDIVTQGIQLYDRSTGAYVDEWDTSGSPSYDNDDFYSAFCNGTDVYFALGRDWNQGGPYIHSFGEDITTSNSSPNIFWNYNSRMPTFDDDISISTHEKVTAFVITDDLIFTSWKDIPSAQWGLKAYYNRDVILKDFKVYGWNGAELTSTFGKLDFTSDMQDYLANADCTTDDELRCDYPLIFSASEGSINFTNIWVNVTQNFDSLQECLDIYNNTASCCMINIPDYSETLEQKSYRIGEADCAVNYNNDNITIDFNNSIIKKHTTGNGLRINGVNNATILNSIFEGGNINYYFLSGSRDIYGENMTSRGGSGFFANGQFYLKNISIFQANSSTGLTTSANNESNSKIIEGMRIIDCNASSSCLSLGQGHFLNPVINITDLIITTVNSPQTDSCIGATSTPTSSAQNITVKDFEINCSGVDAFQSFYMQNGLFMNGRVNHALDGFDFGRGKAHNNTVLNVTFYNNTIGVKAVADGTEIINCTFLDIGKEAIKMASAVQYCSIEGNTFNNTGNAIINHKYFISRQAHQYSGNDYDDCIVLLNNALSASVNITEDDEDVSSILNGTNSINRMWLINDTGNVFTCGVNALNIIMVESGLGTDCATAGAIYGFTCDYIIDNAEVWTNNGAGSNYTFNASILTAIPMVANHTSPPYLRYEGIETQLENPILIEGDNCNVTRNTFYNASPGVYAALNLTSLSSGAMVLLNNFFYGGVVDTGTSNNYCFNGEGNFYNEIIPISNIGDGTGTSNGYIGGDCGPANITRPENQSQYSKAVYGVGYNITWDKQSNADQYFIIYSDDLGASWNYIDTTSNLYYPADLTGFADSDQYIFRLVPYIFGTDYNATNVDSYFTLDTVDPAVTLNSPDNGTTFEVSSVTFNFSASDAIADTLNCSLYLNSALEYSNTSIANNTNVTHTATGLTTDTYTWNVTCWDLAGNSESSTRLIFVELPVYYEEEETARRTGGGGGPVFTGEPFTAPTEPSPSGPEKPIEEVMVEEDQAARPAEPARPEEPADIAGMAAEEIEEEGMVMLDYVIPILILLAVIGAVIAFLVFGKKKGKKHDKEGIRKEITELIRKKKALEKTVITEVGKTKTAKLQKYTDNLFEKGLNQAEIKKKLKNAGWPDEEIEYVSIKSNIRKLEKKMYASKK
ncbi:hypothetical protein ACFL96_14995 [Thermoproteota archaeon]